MILPNDNVVSTAIKMNRIGRNIETRNGVDEHGRVPLENVPVGTLPDGYVRTNPLPQVPTRQSAPITAARLPTYFRLPVVIPTLRRLLGPAIARVRIPS